MRILLLVALAACLTGCDQAEPKPAVGTVSSPPGQEPPASVEVGGPKGGVHVDDPAGGTKVDVDASGVHVKTPDSKVDVP
jgi:hypothetical protein